jgi:hypothetical protein
MIGTSSQFLETEHDMEFESAGQGSIYNKSVVVNEEDVIREDEERE